MHALDYICSLYGISISELAILLGVKQPQVSAWKTGKRPIPKRHIEEMCDIFNFPMEYSHLFGRSSLDEVERANIRLFMEKAKLEHYFENTEGEDTSSDIYIMAKEHQEYNIIIAEKRLEIEEALNELRRVLSDTAHDPKITDKKLDKVWGTINELEDWKKFV